MSELTFIKAFQYYSANRFRPNMQEDQWRFLYVKLQENKITPYELCYYVFTDEGKGIYTPQKLLWKNNLISEEFWERFTEHRNKRIQNIKILIELQRERFRAYVQYASSPLALLENKDYDMCSIVRLDLALIQHFEHKVSIDNLLQVYLQDALLLANGMPEYLRHCPYFKNYCLLNKLLEEGAFNG